ncbi:hypothetical protein SAMN05444359_13943, partial [Neolewinella agarilytica]
MNFPKSFLSDTRGGEKHVCFPLFFLLILFVSPVLAQQSVEFIGAGSGPNMMGPTTTPQVITFYQNATTPSNPPITATFSYSNQQYTSVEGNPTVPGSTFGTTIRTGPNPLDNTAVSIATYGPMNGVSAPTDGNFTSCAECTPGTGISVVNNQAVNLFSSSDALIDNSGNNLEPLNARVHFSDLTITFNRPVNNPILHVVGLGGHYQFTTNQNTANEINYSIGFTTDLDLLTPGLSLTRISGNAGLAVTPTTIRNTNTFYGAPTTPGNVSNIIRGAATGSIVINGFGITSVTFRLYLTGDGGNIRDGNGNPIAAANGNEVMWSSQLGFVPLAGSTVLNAFSGDRYLLGMSLQPCQLVINSGQDQTVCLNETGDDITVQTDVNNANSIRFVRFATDQMAGDLPTEAEANNIYGGTVLQTVTPTGASELYTATYNYDPADFPSPGTYYVYAILNESVVGDCYPVEEIEVEVIALSTAEAGGPDNLCQTDTPQALPLSGASVGGGAATGAWSIVSGGGTLSSTAQTNNPSAVTYTPAAGFTGTVNL